MLSCETRLEAEGPLPRWASTIIVGGGLVGLELALQLCRRGADDVLILEHGPPSDLRHVNLAHEPDAAGALIDPGGDPHFEKSWRSASYPHFDKGSGLRVRLGGRSLYWYGIALPIEPWALRSPWWPRQVVEDLVTSWQGGPSLYERAAEQLARWQQDGQESSGNVEADRVPLNDMIARPAQRAVRKGPGQRWRAYVPTDLWDDSITRSVTIRCGAEVVAVDIQSGYAVGVMVRSPGSPALHRVGADRIVLAAGTIPSSRLVIQAQSDARISSTPRLGGLVDHLAQGFAADVPLGAADLEKVGLTPRGVYQVETDPASRSNLFFGLEPSSPNSTSFTARAIGEQEPRDSNHVECTPNGSRPWITTVRTSYSARDRSELRHQRELLTTLWDNITDRLGLCLAPPSFDGVDEAGGTHAPTGPAHGPAATWQAPLGTEDHEAGTLALGAVLSESGEVNGIPGLSACGPATFPRSGAANPALTALALAHRLAVQVTS